jgi:hypothetical protein
MIDRRRHSSELDARWFRATDCNTDHYLVVAKFRERLAVSKQTTHRVHMERFNLKKLNELDTEGQYHFESEIGSQLWKTETLKWILIQLEKILGKI